MPRGEIGRFHWDWDECETCHRYDEECTATDDEVFGALEINIAAETVRCGLWQHREAGEEYDPTDDRRRPA
jgi:hypothetical protein